MKVHLKILFMVCWRMFILFSATKKVLFIFTVTVILVGLALVACHSHWFAEVYSYVLLHRFTAAN